MMNNYYTEIYPNLANENKVFKHLIHVYSLFSIITEKLEIVYNFAIFIFKSHIHILV